MSSLDSPKHKHSVPRHSFSHFRNTIAAVVVSMSLFGNGEASSAPVSNSKIKDDAPLTSSKMKKPITEVQKRCGLTGGVKLTGEKIMLETVCLTGNKLSVHNVIITADKSGHFNIPGTNSYIYVNDQQEPLISFEKDEERVTGIMTPTEDGGFSFEPYLDFLVPKKEEPAEK